jgi:hypothetical protein
MHTIHVRVNDGATGQPTPVRIRFTGPDGQPYAPFGRLTEFATGRNQDVGGNVLLGAKPYAYIDGSCEIRLPAGPIQVEIHKGPEYVLQRLETVLSPGKLALRFTVERWTDLRREQWFSGDTRAHFLTPHAALLEAQAEDLAVVNLLAAECQVPGSYQRPYPAVSNILAFSGQTAALEKPGHLVVVNTLNTHPVLGSLGLLNCHRIVFPLNFGGLNGREEWSLADWCDQCHRKGGLVVWTRPVSPNPDFPLGEPLADLILGKVDAFELDFFEDSPFDVLPDWYTLLNAGLRVPLAGASGKDSNGSLLGSMRTYARLQPGEDFAYQPWIEAIRAGRTFATNGPILSFQVAGQDPGSALSVPAATQIIPVRAVARGLVPFDRLEVLHNGAVVAETKASAFPESTILETEIPVGTGGWLAARCRGEQQVFHRPANMRVFAHTSPVYLRREGPPAPVDPAAVAALIRQLDRTRDWAHREGRFENDRQHDHLLDIFESARRVLATAGKDRSAS